MADDDPYHDPRDDDGPDEEDALAEAEMNCGQYPGARGCSLAGTEWCDWSCPFSDELFRKLRRRPKKQQPDLFDDGSADAR